MIIALIGMTGSGKTTVGKILADKLHYDFLDTDDIIYQNTQKSPAEIFTESGEEFFRNIESETLENIFKIHNNKNIVLSCGGGIILREKNRGLLRQNSRVIWLVRSFEEIMKNPEILNRPPIYNNPETYIKIFQARKNLYAQTCCFRIDVTDANGAADKIIAELF
jgi:shikimate kinase